MKIQVLSTLLFFTSSLAVAQNPPLEPPYTKGPSTSSSSSGTIERPKKIDEDTGDYFYQPVDSVEAIHYKVDGVPPAKGAFFMRFGMIGPFDIQSDTGTATYKDIYNDKSSFLFYGEYERALGNLGGQWSIKFGTGITTENGAGRFSVDTGITPQEKFLFLVMPNTVLVNYKLRFSETQKVIPYLEGGGGYFTFLEYRDDGDKTVFGGAAVGSAGAGLLISMDLFERNASTKLYEEYGIKNMWLDLQVRQNVGFDKQKDFTSSMITGGFGFAF